MSYKIYHTEGFILGSRPYGEANKIFKILTPDLGLVDCLAQGIRLEKSKLRFGTIDRRFVKISLVRGREHWCLIYIVSDLKLGTKLSVEGLEVFLAKTASLLLRLIQGELADPNLYQILKTAVLAWIENSKNNLKLQSSLEVLTVIRLLSALGYCPDDKDVSLFAQMNNWQKTTLINFDAHLPKAVHSVNVILQNSYL